MSVPVEIGRDEARELARRELSDPRYDSEPPLIQRITEWVIEQVLRLLDAAAGTLTSPVGLLILAAIGAVVAAIVLRFSPLARRAAVRGESLFGDNRRTARDYRSAADAAAREQRWAVAVVERFRAIVATLEERSVLDEQPGRTADEAARDAGFALPARADQLAAAARLFDAIHYGSGDATEDDDRRMRDLDRAISGAVGRMLAVRR